MYPSFISLSVPLFSLLNFFPANLAVLSVTTCKHWQNNLVDILQVTFQMSRTAFRFWVLKKKIFKNALIDCTHFRIDSCANTALFLCFELCIGVMLIFSLLNWKLSKCGPNLPSSGKIILLLKLCWLFFSPICTDKR